MISVIAVSALCYVIKLAGYLIPDSYFANPRFQRINTLIPVVLLSALVAVQTLGNKSTLVIDQRLAGVAVAAIALKFKAPFPVMMLLAAITSALIYRFAY